MDEVKATLGTSSLAAKLGAAMADLAEKYRRPDDPDPCLTCGLRKGTLANMNNRTMLDAMNVLLGLDGDCFGCHHGMDGDGPTRLCAQYVAARRASFDDLKAAFTGLLDGNPEADQVAAYVTAWADQHDPDRKMDNYQLGRLWEKTGPHDGMPHHG